MIMCEVNKQISDLIRDRQAIIYMDRDTVKAVSVDYIIYMHKDLVMLDNSMRNIASAVTNKPYDGSMPYKDMYGRFLFCRVCMVDTDINNGPANFVYVAPIDSSINTAMHQEEAITNIMHSYNEMGTEKDEKMNKERYIEMIGFDMATFVYIGMGVYNSKVRSGYVPLNTSVNLLPRQCQDIIVDALKSNGHDTIEEDLKDPYKTNIMTHSGYLNDIMQSYYPDHTVISTHRTADVYDTPTFFMNNPEKTCIDLSREAMLGESKSQTKVSPGFEKKHQFPQLVVPIITDSEGNTRLLNVQDGSISEPISNED